jgi:hypothetical protein
MPEKQAHVTPQNALGNQKNRKETGSGKGVI